MRISIASKAGGIVLTGVLLTAGLICWTQPGQAADLFVGRTMGFAPMVELDVTAAGAAEDTFKACVARIPAFASAGQRMLAEKSCTGEEEVRKTLRSAPKF